MWWYMMLATVMLQNNLRSKSVVDIIRQVAYNSLVFYMVLNIDLVHLGFMTIVQFGLDVQTNL